VAGAPVLIASPHKQRPYVPSRVVETVAGLYRLQKDFECGPSLQRFANVHCYTALEFFYSQSELNRTCLNSVQPVVCFPSSAILSSFDYNVDVVS